MEISLKLSSISALTLSYHILIASLSSGTPLVPLAILACVSQGVVNVKHDGRNLPLELKVLHRLQSCVRSIKDMSKVDGIATLWRINHVAVVPNGSALDQIQDWCPLVDSLPRWSFGSVGRCLRRKCDACEP